MNNHDIFAVGSSIDRFLFDLRRRVQQLQQSFQMAKTLKKELREAKKKGKQSNAADSGTLSEREQREEVIIEKLNRITTSPVAGKIAELEKTVSRLQEQIMGGSPTNRDHLSCVAIERAGERFAYSGVVVHPQWVLTSGHCTAPTRIFIGDRVSDGIMNDTIFDVEDRGEVGRTEKVRLLRMIRKIPDHVPSVLVGDADTLTDGEDAIIVGFGLGVPGGGAGVKRAGSAKVKKQGQNLTTELPESDASYGDSGGPVIVKGAEGEEVVYGLIDQALRGEPGGGTIYIRFNEDLIKQIETEAGIQLKRYPPAQMVSSKSKKSKKATAKTAKTARNKKATKK